MAERARETIDRFPLDVRDIAAFFKVEITLKEKRSHWRHRELSVKSNSTPSASVELSDSTLSAIDETSEKKSDTWLNLASQSSLSLIYGS